MDKKQLQDAIESLLVPMPKHTRFSSLGTTEALQIKRDRLREAIETQRPYCNADNPGLLSLESDLALCLEVLAELAKQ